MEIHVVQEGETIQSIAELYGIPIDLILMDNGFVESDSLIPGQAIVIAIPEKTYIVQSNDTLQDIADANGITVLELLRNNPFLTDREYIYPNEILIISYGEKIRKVTINGYANAYINIDTLRKTLPFLSYLSVLGYRVTGDGQVVDIDDWEILQLSRAYNAAPLLIINTLSTFGQTNVNDTFTILNNEANMDRLINNLVAILKRKGYYGVNIAYELLSNLTLPAYETFNTKAYNRFKEEGLFYLVTISPNIIFTTTQITFERIDYSMIAAHTDGLVILNYLGGFYLGPPAPVASIEQINEFLDYLSPMVLPEKLVLGLPLVAYDWELPYRIGSSRATLLSLDSALSLAKQNNAIIQFDTASQTPFFTYNAQSTGIPIEHIVWFVDARTMDESMKIITSRGLNGCGIWSIMKYAPQVWTVINTQYEIEDIPQM